MPSFTIYGEGKQATAKLSFSSSEVWLRGGPGVPVAPLCEIIAFVLCPYNSGGQTCQSEELTCNKSSPVLDCYLLHLQWTMFLFITKIEQFIYAMWNVITLCS